MLVTTYVDESGTGGEPRLMLGGLIQRAHKWFRFNRRWAKLLKKSDIPYSHLVAMENKEPPFENWGQERTQQFVRQTIPLVEQDVAWAVTVAIDHSLHEKEYRGKLHPRAHKDSAYGLCARKLMESVYITAKRFWGSDIVLNFVFEDSDHFGEAARVFNDCKAHIPEMTPHLGKIMSGKKADFCGLQAADFLASHGRRMEPILKITEIKEPYRSLAEARGAAGDKIPVFHFAIADWMLPELREQAETISREKKWAKRARGFEKRLRRANLPEAKFGDIIVGSVGD